MSAPSEKLTQRIEEATAKGRPALVPFLPAGYPHRETFWQTLVGLDTKGAAVIEIGMPFSDPVADGPVVERASLKALENGVNLEWILSELQKREFRAGLVLMGYLNPVLQYGLERFARDAARADVGGVILADLPYEEADEVRSVLEEQGVALIPLVGLNTDAERMALYAKHARGFAYFVSVLGTTGARESLPAQVRARLELAKAAFDVPLALGFGLRRPEQLAELTGLVDAAVFGSALIEHLDDGGTVGEFMDRWR
ncbi:tryptophan synthase, alpha chain [Paucidesulfovibrio gracilis DSM 16080]|uniref:Tryptophan synthase alpha chain n=1 Tax=Paucidesulfovibrio gracilis DSM 16080 TaxID=1121449 RepID=A0A1T4W3L0_9BACT|nr:tryptophan synthase subunit alpha [Paucidesulfovibrio gracilis]SKA71894.1 tryptophan synthase, alpha chain [Paucidesulfovibrio gracilis DSM 16080]